MKMKLVIKRKPPPPPLPPFTCVACEEEIERDPFNPDWNAPPVCWRCTWRTSGRMESRQIPYSLHLHFKRFYAVTKAMDKEIERARTTH